MQGRMGNMKLLKALDQPTFRRLMIFGIIGGAMALYYIDTVISWSHRNVKSTSQTNAVVIPYNDRNNYCPQGHRVLTVDTGDGKTVGFLCKFLEFALRHDINPRILWWGQKWIGYINKVFALKEELANYPPDCIVLFMDVDMIFQQGWDEILEKYTDTLTSPGVLMGAECACFPWIMWDKAKCTSIYPESPTKYRYGNAGFFIGRAEDLYVFYEALWKRAGEWMDPMADDQALATIFHMENPETFGTAIDHYNEIHQSMFNLDTTHSGYEDFKWKGTVLPNPENDDETSCDPTRHLVLDKGFWRNNYTKSTPSLLHFNAMSKMAHIADPYIDAIRQARLEMLGPEKSQQEILRVKRTKVELGNGSSPTFAQLCPTYTDIDKEYK